jgi:putative N-acetyltransferase (TIGR04045 family)
MFEALLCDVRYWHLAPARVRAEIARERWQIEAYFALRQQIFAHEQGLFRETDRDPHDEHALPIVAMTEIAGMPDRVVGVVRIYEARDHTWFGGRLGVDRDHRRAVAIGTALITEAVSSAHARGAREFLATVQPQNVRYFRRHHFHPLERVQVCGVPHCLMRADLSAYPPELSSGWQRSVA